MPSRLPPCTPHISIHDPYFLVSSPPPYYSDPRYLALTSYCTISLVGVDLFPLQLSLELVSQHRSFAQPEKKEDDLSFPQSGPLRTYIGHFELSRFNILSFSPPPVCKCPCFASAFVSLPPPSFAFHPLPLLPLLALALLHLANCPCSNGPSPSLL